jgi:predicted SAM-dependent methyltransferase
MEEQMKLNLGAGKDIKSGYTNHDIANLDGIDIVHNLNQYPWPWEDKFFNEILAMDILEHLDDFVKSMEELHRILKPGGTVTIRVPYWNHSCAYIDPTHKRGFHEQTFHFFDVNSNYFKDRDYYSKARFKTIDEALILVPGEPYFGIPGIRLIYIRNSFLKKIVGWFGNHLSNIIADVQVVMKKV